MKHTQKKTLLQDYGATYKTKNGTQSYKKYTCHKKENTGLHETTKLRRLAQLAAIQEPFFLFHLITPANGFTELNLVLATGKKRKINRDKGQLQSWKPLNTENLW